MLISPLDVVRWTFRRSSADAIRLYDALSGVMRLATGGDSLNFGLWVDSCAEPLLAQENMARHFGKVAELQDAQTAADVGCGRAGPARVWQGAYPNVRMVCIDINRRGLRDAGFLPCAANAISTSLPLASGSMDRVLALESAQHFRPMAGFTAEAARVLGPEGILCLAVPVAGPRYAKHRLGMLWLTWSSEHHTMSTVRESVSSAGLQLLSEERVGGLVYEPMAEYYLKNRVALRRRIRSGYPGYVESLLHRSILDMRRASERGVIDYVIVKCKKANGSR